MKSQAAEANSTMLDFRFTTHSNCVVVSQNRNEQLHNQGHNEDAVPSYIVCWAIRQAGQAVHLSLTMAANIIFEPLFVQV